MRNETVLRQGPNTGVSANSWEVVCLPVSLAWPLMLWWGGARSICQLRVRVQAHRQYEHRTMTVTTGRAKYTFTLLLQAQRNVPLLFLVSSEVFHNSSSNPLGACPATLFWRAHRGVTRHPGVCHCGASNAEVLGKLGKHMGVLDAVMGVMDHGCPQLVQLVGVQQSLQAWTFYQCHVTRVYSALGVGVLSHTYFRMYV